MQMKKKVLLAVAAVGALALWALFRPELLFIDSRVDEKFPAASATAGAQATVLARGEFRGLAHDTKGTATLHQVAGGRRVLRLSSFETSNGPALHVYLVAAPDAPDNDTVKSAGYLDLGGLKGNVGDQNYDVPVDADLAKYRSVSIWCQRFGVNFGAAPLTGPATMAEPRVLSSGDFRGLAHETKGKAAIYELDGGRRVLRLSGFETSNGPALHVYLVAAPDAPDNDTVKSAGYVDLGGLKGNVGDQNYDVPVDADLAKYRSVSIWCQRFGVNFGAAPLSAGMP